MPVRASVLLRILVPLTVGLCASAAFAQARAFGVVEGAMQLRANMTVAQLRALVETRLVDASLDTADDQLLNAELLKQLGDPRAVDAYEAAIAAARDAPAYELFYADYLRNYRGPRRPLFREAADHYFAALAKVRDQPHAALADRIDRGLVALYQEDGIPIAWSGERPMLFFTSIDRMAHAMADLDEVHDMRDFTSEALRASSGGILHRPLTIDELRGVARVKTPRVTFNRLRFRRGGAAMELFHEGREISAARMTNPFEPTISNDVTLSTAGAAIEYVTSRLAPLDLYGRLAYARASRKGVVEFLPEEREHIEQFDVRIAAARFVGPDKILAELSTSLQDLELANLPNAFRHERQIAAITGDYHLIRPLPFLSNSYGLFATRGMHLRAGVALDVEWFGDVRVGRRDLFAGVTANGLGRFDVTVAPGIIRATVSNDPSQTHQHRRIDANVVIRLVDEELEPGIPRTQFLGLHPAFVHLVFPYKKDVAMEGLDAFENEILGAMVVVKLFRRALSTPQSSRAHPTTFLFSMRYDRQRFPRLDRSEDLVGVSFSFGY